MFNTEYCGVKPRSRSYIHACVCVCVYIYICVYSCPSNSDIFHSKSVTKRDKVLI